MKNQTKQKATKGDKTRQRVLETASAMMAEKGPDGVSMREISAKLRISKPVLYYYFKNKDELIKAAFVEGTKHFNELLHQIADPELTLEKKLEKFFTDHLNFIERYPDMPKCALKLMASPSAGILNSLARELKERNRGALRAMLRKEKLPRQGAENVLHMVSAVIDYFIIEARENGAASLDKGLPGRLARLICSGARHMKAVAAALLLAAMISARASAAGLNLTVDEAINTALANNATVITAEETRRIYKERVSEYWGSVYPQISATAKYTRNIESPSFFLGATKIKTGLNNVYTAGLNLDQVLWAGGKVYTGIKMANIYSEASDEQLRTAQKGVAKAVKQIYYSVLLARAMTGIQKESLDLARQHLDTIQAQYKQGIASDLAVLREQVEVSNTEPALTQAQNLYEEGLLELKNLLGLDPEAEIALSDNLVCAAGGPADAVSGYAEALANRPEYRDMKYQRDLYREMITIERAGHFPYLSAFAAREFQGQSDSGFPDSGQQSWSTTAGIKLSLPLFAGGSVSSRTRQAKLQADIAATNLAELERRIKIEVKEAWLSAQEASERLRSQTTAVEQAHKALSATEIRFKNGLSGQLELNDAALALNKAQTLYTQAQHDVCSTNAELKWTLGE